jgi:polysaccharide export outer membrane protein
MPEQSESDGQLLAEFVRTGEGDFFSRIVLRHWDSVLRLCGSVLKDSADAEDAAQAVFLTLAQKAPSLTRHTSIAAWLYQVAWYISMRAARERKSRSAHERRAVSTSLDFASPDPLEQAELSQVLIEELNRLGENLRLPILLHYFHEQSVSQGAALLNWRVGTFASRLARGRELLKSRLLRRGVSLPAQGVGASLLAISKPAVTSPALVAAIGRLASLLAAGQQIDSLASARTLTWTKGALKMIVWNKAKMAAGVAFLSLLLVGTAVVIAQVQRNKNVSSAPATAPAQTSGAANSPAQQKVKIAEQALDLAIKLSNRGLGQGTEDIDRWARRVKDAKLELATTEQARSAAIQEYVKQMKDIETLTKQKFSAGLAGEIDVDAATYQRIEAEDLAGAK